MNRLLKISIPILLTLGLIFGVGCASPIPAKSVTVSDSINEPPPPMLAESGPSLGLSLPRSSFLYSSVDTDDKGYKYRANDAQSTESAVTTYGAADTLTPTVGQQWATERMIVRTGNISLLTDDIPAAIDQITQFTKNLGGYVVSSSTWRERESLIGAIAIRVPAEHFEDTMGKLHEIAVEVTFENTSSNDVTEEYVDLSAKIKNFQVAEEQLLKLMEQAKTVDEILNIQRELTRTRGEIEQTKGRMEYLEKTSGTSLIEVKLEQANLEVNFTASKTSVEAGEKIHFTSQIAGGFAPYSYEWDFGDGDISTANGPIHTYRSAGKYTVSLKLTDDRGNEDTEIRKDYIVIISGWNPGNVAAEAWSGLATFGQVLANILIWIGIFSPVWIVVGGGVYWLYRRRKKMH